MNNNVLFVTPCIEPKETPVMGQKGNLILLCVNREEGEHFNYSENMKQNNYLKKTNYIITSNL